MLVIVSVSKIHLKRAAVGSSPAVIEATEVIELNPARIECAQEAGTIQPFGRCVRLTMSSGEQHVVPWAHYNMLVMRGVSSMRAFSPAI